MQSFSKDPFRDESQLEDEWFSKEKPTWKPPKQSSRPPPSEAAPELEEEVQGWFV